MTMNNSTRGTKRKRPGSDNKKKEKTSTIATKLHHSLQLLSRAAKKAKTFELQKLVRKIKDDKSKKPVAAGPSPEELAYILDALKELDIDMLVASVLLSRLSKDKTGLAANEHVQQFCSQLQQRIGNDKQEVDDPGSSKGKAKNRIMAHKVFQEELKNVLQGFKEKAGLEVRASSSSKKPTSTTAAMENKTDEAQKDALSVLAKLSSKGKARQVENHDERSTDASTSDEEEEEDEDDDDDATVSHISADEDEMRAAEIGFDGISASGSSDEDDDDEDEASISSSSSFLSTGKDLKAEKVKKADQKSKVKAPTAPTTSAFLPSLAAGYTIGDEDGSVYGSDEDGAGSAQVTRKNRRGQRARQAIWEKKYGKNAKHVKQRNELHTATDASRARMRAEKEIEKLRKSGRYNPDTVDANLTALGTGDGKGARAWNTDGSKESSGPTVEEILKKERERKDEEWRKKKEREARPIHGSWEAKKKQKELEAMTLLAKPQGKKIVF